MASYMRVKGRYFIAHVSEISISDNDILRTVAIYIYTLWCYVSITSINVKLTFLVLAGGLFL